MARNDRRRSRQWHFSSSSNRFDTRRRYRAVTDTHPISETFTRKIIHCKRCGSRVVSNVNHCPYCGKSLLPLYKRLWFWLVIVILTGAGTVALVVFFSPVVEEPEAPPEIPAPIVEGASAGTSIKNLPLATTVNCNGLLVTISGHSQELTASNGSPITAVTVQFVNEGTTEATLYSTQWQLETTNGNRVDCYIGKTEGGESVRSDLDSASLPSKASLAVTLYFAAADPAKLVFAPNALSYSEEGLVTWQLTPPNNNPQQEDDTSDA
ncbi:MAG: zinc ribbon domain-containing protein [Coriobacteriales bacterium]|nr:zinc ribbon domain-containing protein [Coriobacteriales bacterium]